MKQFVISSISELEEVVNYIVEKLDFSKIVLFNAPMGAGKTTLIAAICKRLHIEENVSSPTYAIYNEYFSKEHGVIYHFDCYRLKDEWEALDSGIEEILDSGNLCLIEWPNKIEKLLPDNCVQIEIEVKNGNRTISILL